MVRLGVVVYVWGTAAQDRLLADRLGPEAERLCREGLAARLWFDRYDARGPHVFAVLTVASAAGPAVRSRIEESLAAYLATRPSAETLSARQLEKLHAQTRGRRQCEADGLPGFAPNNSFVTFDHPARGYPFHLSEGLAAEADLWQRVSATSFWAVRQLGRESLPAARAARWTAAVDRALRESGESPGLYWRHHLSTLLPLEGGLGDGDLAILAGSLGEDRRRDLARLWENPEGEEPPVSALVRLALAASASRRWPLLREIDHVTLKQLGLPVALHVPLLLYAWSRRESG
jgi:hypothetical protein